jgi:hypothetical protein
VPVLAIGASAGLRDAARVRKAAGLARWPNNGLPHSFASYRLAACHNAPHVASELGHTSPQMLYSTYRELVLPEEAERYWKVVPQSGEATNVVSFTTSATDNQGKVARRLMLKGRRASRLAKKRA